MIFQNIKKIFVPTIMRIIMLLVLTELIFNYYSLEPLNSNNNAFNIVGSKLNLIYANFNWILYYLIAEMLLLPVLQQQLLNQDAFILVRRRSRRKNYFQVILTIIIASFLYNIYFIGMSVLASKGTIARCLPILFIKSWLSLVSFTLFLLLLGMIFSQVISWQVGVMWGAIVLFFKVNFMMLIAKVNNYNMSTDIIWILILGIGLYFLNEQFEVRKVE